MSDFALASQRPELALQILEMLGQKSADKRPELRQAILRVLEEVDDQELRSFLLQVERTGDEWGYHPPNPVARELVRAVQDVLLLPGSELRGTGTLEITRERPTLFFGNHVSFADANVLEYFMSATGYADVATRLVAAVGPKVYASIPRRVASLAFGTIKLPQSTSRATAEVRLGAREVARLSRQALETAAERLAAGDHLIVFVEGSRSRNEGMKTALPAIARYLSFPDLMVVPVGLWGGEDLSPADESGLATACVQGQLGAPVEARQILELCGRNRVLAMHVVGVLIARLLPPPYQGAYAESAPGLAQARALAGALPGA